MNAALIYRPNSRKRTWIAFACAITIHLSAIAIAGNKSRPALVTWGGEPDDGGIGFDPPPQVEDVSPPEEILPAPDEDAFPQDNSASVPVHPRKMTLVTPIRSTNIGAGRAANAGSVKALTLYAPKPNYPYEARRGNITGSGVARLEVNPATGNVLDAQMRRSTASPILDRATIDALRRWRFKPGVASSVDVPITYTLSGASY